MKKLFLLGITIFFFPRFSYSQNEGLTSKPVIEIITDFHLNLKKDSIRTTGFSLNRAYFGYNYAIGKNYYSIIILNIGTPEDLAPGSKPKRYAYFREASINYSNQRITLSMGMITAEMFSFQSKFYGMRYLASTFQELNGYGFNADLGAAFLYKFNDRFNADITVTNGEGSANIQADNNLKGSLGLTFIPVNSVSVRLYGDMIRLRSVWQGSFIAFGGIRTGKYFLGGEFNYKTALDTINGHNAWGISITGGVNLSEKLMLFCRYDLSQSVKPAGEATRWNIMKDNSFLITGIQYQVSGTIRVALDYHALLRTEASKAPEHMIYLNGTLKF